MKVLTYILYRKVNENEQGWALPILALGEEEAITKAKKMSRDASGELWLADRKVADI